MINWFCGTCDDGIEYDEPGSCPKCNTKLHDWEEEEIEWHLYATPWYGDE